MTQPLVMRTSAGRFGFDRDMGATKAMLEAARRGGSGMRCS